MRKNLSIWFLSVTLLNPSFCFSQVVDDYKSNSAAGTWATRTDWLRWDGGAWVVPTAGQGAPNNTKGTITIQAGHLMTIGAAVTVDQVVIDAGGRVQLNNFILTVANGAGTDITINGTFIDSSAASLIVWNAGATWIMGAAGTLRRCRITSSSNNWQTTYEAGISNIPATANWVIARRSAEHIALSSTSPASGSIYPNLILENYVAGAYTSASPCVFTGSTATPTIKGNFDIGGAGTSTFNFLTDNTFASLVLVQGNLIIRTGSTLRNHGTGYEIQGNLTVDGTILYDAADGRKLIFSGGNAQTFSGTGTPNIYAMTMSKSANSLTLNRAITVDNVLTMTAGIINSTAANLLTVNTSGTVSGANNSSFVSGPVRYVGTAAFTFPVGKGTDYQPVSYGASGGAGVFYTENFNPAGAWSLNVSTGGNSASYNMWYISCQEDGLPAGQCGSGCFVGNSLHLGSQTLGDLGAAYDAAQTTNRRAESPTIVCTGRTGITLTFSYIEFGEGATDDATVWYYDGSTWALLNNPAKTSCCSGACDGQDQGLWTAYSFALPASANNNPAVKIGFNWTNNASAGTDPSFAVWNVQLSGTPAVDFTCEYFYADPRVAYGTAKDATIDHISGVEYWVLTRNAGSASKTVTLSWDGNSGGITNLADLAVAKWDGSTWKDLGQGGTTGNTSAGTVWTSSAVTTFSPFTLASKTAANPLPVELLNFNAAYNGKDVDLNWNTATEINNNYFTVEKSADGEKFQEIMKVKSRAPNGNSNIQLDYHAVDNKTSINNQQLTILYYRLKQTDFDGAYSYSEIVAVDLKQNSPFEIISVSGKSDNNYYAIIQSSKSSFIKLEIFDAAGKLINSWHFQTAGNITNISLNTNSLAKGMYLLKASDGKTVKSKKFNL